MSRDLQVAIDCADPHRLKAVPEPKTVKDRIHLDIHTSEGERDRVVAWCVEHGARVLWEGSQGPHTWITLADPEGNEFCVS